MEYKNLEVLKYYILTDKEFNGEIFRQVVFEDENEDEHICYQRFVYGPNNWVKSSLLDRYLDSSSNVYGQYEVITEEKEIINTLSNQIETYERLWNMAYTLSNRVHEGAVDKNGVDYIQHPIYVAKQFDKYDFKIVAILHDVVEDTDVTLDDLRKYDYPPKIIDAIDAITKRPGEDYFDYIRRLKGNYIARLVKIEDIKHNLQPERLYKVENKESLKEKYKKALKLLES